jgi:GNAT superfamily N-acetyltransferase
VAIAVQRFDPDEWALYRELRLRALSESPQAFTSTHEREAAFEEPAWRARSASMAYATRDGVPAGIAGAMREPESESTLLVAMWVAPEHRGAGVGEALVAWVVDRARERGHERVWLWYTDGNDPARRLYERIGFVEIADPGSLPGRLDECDHAMVLDLDS